MCYGLCCRLSILNSLNSEFHFPGFVSCLIICWYTCDLINQLEFFFYFFVNFFNLRLAFGVRCVRYVLVSFSSCDFSIHLWLISCNFILYFRRSFYTCLICYGKYFIFVKSLTTHPIFHLKTPLFPL